MYKDYFNETNLLFYFLVGNIKVPAEDGTDTNHYSVKPKPLLFTSQSSLLIPQRCDLSFSLPQQVSVLTSVRQPCIDIL